MQGKDSEVFAGLVFGIRREEGKKGRSEEGEKGRRGGRVGLERECIMNVLTLTRRDSQGMLPDSVFPLRFRCCNELRTISMSYVIFP